MSIKVNTATLKEMSTYSKNISLRVGYVASEVQSVKYSLSLDVLNNQGLGTSLNCICKKIDGLQRKINNLSVFLESTAQKYCETEDHINKSFNNDVMKITTAQQSNMTIKKASRKGAAEIANEILGEAGFIGGIAAFATKPVAKWMDTGIFSFGETGAKALSEISKSGGKAFKTLSEWNKSDKDLNLLSRMKPEQAKKTNFKRLFGLNDVFTGHASKASSWGEKFIANCGKRTKEVFKDFTKGGAKAAFALGGVALTAIGNGIDNYEEANSGEITKVRAVEETILETAIDVGTGFVIGTAVAAGVAATVGSAPVLAVGLLTVGVTIGLDYACKEITGRVTGTEKGLTETISDSILDFGPAAVAKGKDIINFFGFSK